MVEEPEGGGGIGTLLLLNLFRDRLNIPARMVKRRRRGNALKSQDLVNPETPVRQDDRIYRMNSADLTLPINTEKLQILHAFGPKSHTLSALGISSLSVQQFNAKHGG